MCYNDTVSRRILSISLISAAAAGQWPSSSSQLSAENFLPNFAAIHALVTWR
jgi:hypothetical protein